MPTIASNQYIVLALDLSSLALVSKISVEMFALTDVSLFLQVLFIVTADADIPSPTVGVRSILRWELSLYIATNSVEMAPILCTAAN